jgi:hypothetical protein
LFVCLFLSWLVCLWMGGLVVLSVFALRLSRRGCVHLHVFVSLFRVRVWVERAASSLHFFACVFARLGARAFANGCSRMCVCLRQCLCVCVFVSAPASVVVCIWTRIGHARLRVCACACGPLPILV